MRERLYKHQAEYFKALAHPLRIAIIESLRHGELTVGQIIQKFGVAQANASQHLAVLRHNNVITARKQGTNVYYSVTNSAIHKLLDTAHEIFKNRLRETRHMLKEIESKENRSRGRDSR